MIASQFFTIFCFYTDSSFTRTHFFQSFMLHLAEPVCSALQQNWTNELEMSNSKIQNSRISDSRITCPTAGQQPFIIIAVIGPRQDIIHWLSVNLFECLKSILLNLLDNTSHYICILDISNESTCFDESCNYCKNQTYGTTVSSSVHTFKYQCWNEQLNLTEYRIYSDFENSLNTEY